MGAAETDTVFLALTGQVAGRFQSVVPVREIIHATVNEFRARVAEPAQLL